ncbi:ATP-binding protein [Oxalobacteraceae bacterium]|nr:ATP-binding protein [Oxalobacteraceae bacterium]
MAHITEFKIDGLLGRKKQIHIKLQRDVNIFFGENGSGKTTLLKILDAAMSGDSSIIQGLPVDRAEVDIFSVDHNRVFKHVWERKNSERVVHSVRDQYEMWQNESGEHIFKVKSESSEWKVSPSPKKQNSRTRWAHTFLPTTRLYLSENSRVSNNRPTNEGQFDVLFSESVNKSWLVYNSSVLAEVRKIQEEGLRAVLNHALSPSHSTGINSELDPKQAYERVSKFLKRQSAAEGNILGTKSSFIKRYESEDNLRKVVGNIDNIELRIEHAMIPINRFLLTIKNLFSRGKAISAENNQLSVQLETGELLTPASLSSGEKHILKILLATMTGGESSIIIDEPELSMHIDWQRAFINTMRDLNPSCQIIVASHSPEIMAEIEDDKIFRI